ncbi:MAG: hypothetical protein J5U19_14610 [Candidatus Methanoperedens sp.]|nr:hypothetical protein [Candidatus Methanoperedens sp.]
MGCNKAGWAAGGILDVSRAERKFGGRAKVEFEGGLKTLVIGWMDGKMGA